MKNLACFLLVAGLGLTLEAARAQEKTQERPNTEQRAKPPIPMKVQIVFTELDGEKKISSLPYAFGMVVDEKASGRWSVNLRTGIRVPIEVNSKDAKTTYQDIGTNIDCGIRAEEDGKFRMFLNFDRSALYPNKSAEGERLVSEPNGLPLIRQFRISDELILKDGQTTDLILSTDPVSGHVLKASVSINVVR